MHNSVDDANSWKMAAQLSVNRLTATLPNASISHRANAVLAAPAFDWPSRSDVTDEYDETWPEFASSTLAIETGAAPRSAVYGGRCRVHALTWWTQAPAVVLWALGLSGLLGLVAWKLRTATPAAAATGAIITASLMFSTFVFPYQPWNTALVPVLAVLLLTSLATRFGRRRKERLGTAEKRHGRGASQVAANLGMAALVIGAGRYSLG